jgi:hypothetical protein
MDTAALNLQTGWTAKQRNHLRRLIRQGAEIAYVVTDRHGRPSNGGPSTREWQVRPGLVQHVVGPLTICTPKALHGTLEPHRWRGERVWVAGFVGPIDREGDKIGSLHREIVGEVYHECALSDSVGVRIGRTDLRGADLRDANLCGTDLSGADLYSANLRGADLYSANLRGADLSGADLHDAYLEIANLYSANLRGADLSGADLYDAYLEIANLHGANLHGAYRPNAKAVQAIIDAGYENDGLGYLRKKA